MHGLSDRDVTSTVLALLFLGVVRRQQLVHLKENLLIVLAIVHSVDEELLHMMIVMYKTLHGYNHG